MFGYVIANKECMSQEELARYQGFYCGLCKTLERDYGQLERITLNYDMTFLAIFLSALYEPMEEQKSCKCVFHGFKERPVIENEYIDYAAAMTIVLTYYKCLDDWNDERKWTSQKYGQLLKKSYYKIKEKYPRQCESIEQSIWKQSIAEKDHTNSVDDAINYAGMLLSEVFVYKEDFWSDYLRTFGYELGRFIYLMDAAMDYEKDLKKNNYNPLVKLNKRPEEVKDLLEMAIGDATVEFERLPITQDEHLLRNILYGGVWQQYYEKIGKEKKKRGK